jgi:hypothetical protein
MCLLWNIITLLELKNEASNLYVIWSVHLHNMNVVDEFRTCVFIKKLVCKIYNTFSTLSSRWNTITAVQSRLETLHILVGCCSGPMWHSEWSLAPTEISVPLHFGKQKSHWVPNLVNKAGGKQVKCLMLYFTIMSVCSLFTWWKVDSLFVRLEYIFHKKENRVKKWNAVWLRIPLWEVPSELLVQCDDLWINLTLFSQLSPSNST